MAALLDYFVLDYFVLDYCCALDAWVTKPTLTMPAFFASVITDATI